jgi:hypothetical protein
MCGLKENSNKMASKSFRCEMTAISSFYNKIFLSMPLFSLVYFILSWAFVAFFTIFFFYSLSKKPEKNFNLNVSVMV